VQPVDDALGGDDAAAEMRRWRTLAKSRRCHMV
jgi:hypothetical protein